MLSFAADIKPMFTAMDQDHMFNQQEMFDLWSHKDVSDNAQDILTAVRGGMMPPESSGESRWTSEMVAKFEQWINDGCQP